MCIIIIPVDMYAIDNWHVWQDMCIIINFMFVIILLSIAITIMHKSQWLTCWMGTDINNICMLLTVFLEVYLYSHQPHQGQI